MLGWQAVLRRPLQAGMSKTPKADSGIGYQPLLRDKEPATNFARKLVPVRHVRRPGKLASTAVHFGYGTMTAAAYPLLFRRFEFVRRSYGLPFGLVVWVGAAQLSLPLLGLSKKPWDSSWQIQLFGLSAHLLYAAPVEVACRLCERR